MILTLTSGRWFSGETVKPCLFSGLQKCVGPWPLPVQLTPPKFIGSQAFTDFGILLQRQWVWVVGYRGAIGVGIDFLGGTFFLQFAKHHGNTPGSKGVWSNERKSIFSKSMIWGGSPPCKYLWFWNVHCSHYFIGLGSCQSMMYIWPNHR